MGESLIVDREPLIVDKNAPIELLKPLIVDKNAPIEQRKPLIVDKKPLIPTNPNRSTRKKTFRHGA